MTRQPDHDSEIVKLIGEATVSWNGIEHGWMLIFQWLLSAPNRECAEAAFFAVNSSAAQRRMVGAMAEIALKDNTPHLEEVRDLLDVTGKQSGWRNAFIHGFYGYEFWENEKTKALVQSALMVIDSGPNKLNSKDLQAELQRLIPRFNQISQKVLELWRRLAEQRPPSPDKLAPQ